MLSYVLIHGLMKLIDEAREFKEYALEGSGIIRINIEINLGLIEVKIKQIHAALIT